MNQYNSKTIFLSFFTVKRLILLSLQISFCVGCMVGPSNGESKQNKFDSEVFEGWHSKGNVWLEIQARRIGTNKWDTFDTVYVSDQPFSDPTGRKWYYWLKSSDYPRNSRYWSASGVGEFRATESGNPVYTMTGSQYACAGEYAYDNTVSFITGYQTCVPNETNSVFITSPCEGGGCGDLPDEYETTDFPFDISYEFANGIQGIAHDDTHWFLTSSHTPWTCIFGDCDKISRYALVGKNDLNNISSSDYIEGIFEPGFHHPGGIDYFNNWVYIALSPDGGDSVNTAIGVIRKDKFSSSFSSTTHKVLKIFDGPQSIANKKNMSWIARDPQTGFWYSSKFNDDKLYRYQIPINSSGVPQSIEYCGEIDLGFTINRVQGGVFSPTGRLYLSQDTNANEAIAIIEMQSLFLGESSQCGATVSVKPDFVGNFRVNFIPGDEEIEGLTFWDLEDGSISGMDGLLHTIVLDVGEISNDDFYFKHLTINPKGEF